MIIPKEDFEKIGKAFDQLDKIYLGQSYDEDARQKFRKAWLMYLERAGYTEEDWLETIESRIDAMFGIIGNEK